MNITCLGISWRLPEWTIVLYRSTAMTMRIRVELNTGIAGAVFTTLQSTLAEGSHGQYWKGETGMQLRANIYLYSVNIQIVSKKNSQHFSSQWCSVETTDFLKILPPSLNKIIARSPCAAANKKRGVEF